MELPAVQTPSFGIGGKVTNKKNPNREIFSIGTNIGIRWYWLVLGNISTTDYTDNTDDKQYPLFRYRQQHNESLGDCVQLCFKAAMLFLVVLP